MPVCPTEIDSDAGDAYKGTEHHLSSWPYGHPFGVPGINAIEFFALFLQGLTYREFYQAQHPQADAKQADQPLYAGG